eukprot:2706750-Amphidinium_carterae.1
MSTWQQAAESYRSSSSLKHQARDSWPTPTQKEPTNLTNPSMKASLVVYSSFFLTLLIFRWGVFWGEG